MSIYTDKHKLFIRLNIELIVMLKKMTCAKQGYMFVQILWQDVRKEMMKCAEQGYMFVQIL